MPQSQTRPLGAQISHMLKDRGVETIFGVPGVHNQELYRGIEEAGLRHVLARHEQGAGFMADGYARATGRPGVAYVITGPGVCNIMTPMGQAWSDSVPMLVIASCLDETAAVRGQLHQMKDQEGAARTVSDWSETALTADAAYALIDRALTEFACTRPRPKALHVPIRQLEAQAAPPPPRPQPVRAAATPDSAGIEDVVTALRAAKRPLMLLGGGARAAAEPLQGLLQISRIASFTTYAGRGIVPDDAPLHFGSTLARASSAEVFAAADLVLFIGTDVSEVDLWRDHPGHKGRAIYVNIDPEALGPGGQDDLRLMCDSGAFLHALTLALGDIALASDWRAADVAARRAAWAAEIDAERPGILPVAAALRACLPQGCMVYSDMTQFAYAAKEVWPMDAPGHWHHPFGFGTLGYALPAAIGGAVGRPGLPTLAIAGDYGFQYTVQELGTAVELGLPLPIIVWDNGRLGEIEEGMIRAQIAPNAVVQCNPDFCKLAEAYGAASAAPDTLADLPRIMAAAFAAAGPTVIHLRSSLVKTG